MLKSWLTGRLYGKQRFPKIPTSPLGLMRLSLCKCQFDKSHVVVFFSVVSLDFIQACDNLLQMYAKALQSFNFQARFSPRRRKNRHKQTTRSGTRKIR